MKKFRLWRLQRKYRQLQKLELALGYSREVRQLRVAFADQTMNLIDGAWARMGAPRAERRKARRRIAGMT